VDRGDDAERPTTTRIGPAAGMGRGLSMVVVLVALALVVAVVKPWDWFAAPAVAPGREGAAIPAARPGTSPTVAPTPASHDLTGAGPQGACLFGASWLAVVDQVNGPVTSRSWTRLDLVPATGPLDPAIARTHVYAESVPRIGFCAPGSANAAGAAGASAQFRVRAWRLTSVEALADGSATDSIASRRADEIVPPVVSGGTTAEGGSLFGPPEGLAVGGGEGRASDPKDAPGSAGGAAPGEAGRLAPGSARRRAYGGGQVQASWPPSIYVFRVDALGSGPAGPGVAWFAIELRGPWTGPGESPTP
jgi:hypothetical protein